MRLTSYIGVLGKCIPEKDEGVERAAMQPLPGASPSGGVPPGSQADPAHHQKLRARELPKSRVKASLMARWIRIQLLMQRTQVRSQVWEDFTCSRAATPLCHDY